MSLRLISTRKHPISGEEVKPLWFDQDGTPFYLPMGAAPDTEETEGEEPEGDEGGEKGSEGPEGSEDSDKVSKSELEKALERMKAADKRASAAEAKIKEFEDKDKSEITKATERATVLETENATLKAQVSDLTAQVAFLSENSIDWYDKKDALKFIDLQEVMDEDGTVDPKALKKALEDLAKSKPHLVKKTEQEEEPNEPSGIPAGSGRKGGGKGLSEEALRKKYPALNR